MKSYSLLRAKSTVSSINVNNVWHSPWLLAFLAALLLTASFPPFDAGILQFPAFILLFRIAELSVSNRQMIYYTYPSFVLWNLGTTYWLMMADISAGVAAIFANAALMLIPLWLIRKLMLSKISPIILSFLAGSVWVCYEFLHHNWDLAWPWLTLGNAWANLTGLIQYISVTGVWGISFWVVFGSMLLYQYIVTISRPVLYSSLIIIFAFPLFSILSFIAGIQDYEEQVNVVIVQPNSDSYQDFGGLDSLDDLITHLLELSAQAVTSDTDLILWPENAIASDLRLDSPHIYRIRDSLSVWNTELITGTGYLRVYDDGEAPELFRGTFNGQPANIFNAAFHIKPEQKTAIYEKGRLVPVVERFPFVEFFKRADYFNWVDWGSIMQYGLGTDPTVFQISEHSGTTPALICYDSVFPGWVNQFVNNGADFISIVTNDGWWGDSAGHVQHFAYARLRAIEHRMWVARSANNGISGIISPDGKVQYETEYWTETSFPFTIYRSQKSTFYSRNGDWLGYLSVLFSLLSFVFVYKPEFDS